MLALSAIAALPAHAQQQDQDNVPASPAAVTRETTPQEAVSPRSPASSGPAYLIGPEDVLGIDVFNVPELSRLVVRVANDGTIALPLLGQVPAAGLTTDQLAEELISSWGKSYLENPQITVFVQEFHSRPVSVIGAVEKPGLYQLTAPRSLVEMLSMAGGLAKRTSAPAGRTVYVTRKEGFEEVPEVEGLRMLAADKVEINLRRLLYSHEDALNIEIKPLDIISVSKADIIYVGGNGVRRPGVYVLEDRDKVTVIQALAMAEGFSLNASKGNARIIRTQSDGSRTQIPVNLNDIVKGKSADVELAANDILFVPDSAQRAALKRGIDAAIATISSYMVFRF